MKKTNLWDLSKVIDIPFDIADYNWDTMFYADVVNEKVAKELDVLRITRLQNSMIIVCDCEKYIDTHKELVANAIKLLYDTAYGGKLLMLLDADEKTRIEYDEDWVRLISDIIPYLLES